MKQYIQLAVPLLIAAACTDARQSSPTAPEFKSALARNASASIAVLNLPSLGGSSTARAINDDQVIVGSSNGLPVKWTLGSGSWHVQALQSTSGSAEDITESGVITGSSGNSVALWVPGSAPEIVGVGSARAINESQVIVGEDASAADGNPARAWTRSGSGWVVHILPRQAGVSDGYYAPRDINDDGVIVGDGGSAAGGGTHPIKWVPNPTTGEWDPAVPLDEVAATHLGGTGAILGQDIVGNILRCLSCNSSNLSRDPYHWSLTLGQGIGSLGSADAWAEGVNAQRSIVGTFMYRGMHAFVWTVANPTIRDLGAPNGYQSASAYDINSPKVPRTTTQVVGEATSRKGTVAVLWTLP
jgi:hypothetical protein